MLAKKYWIIFSSVMFVGIRAIDTHVPGQELIPMPQFSSKKDLLFLKESEQPEQKKMLRSAALVKQVIPEDPVKLLINRYSSKRQRCKRSQSADSYTSKMVLEEKLQEAREREVAQSQRVIEPVKDPIVLIQASCYRPLSSLGGRIDGTQVEEDHRGSKRYRPDM
jgi:hypothetical protein